MWSGAFYKRVLSMGNGGGKAQAIAAEMIAEMAGLTTVAEIDAWWQAQQSGRWQALDRGTREQVDVALNRRRYSLRPQAM